MPQPSPSGWVTGLVWLDYLGVLIYGTQVDVANEAILPVANRIPRSYIRDDFAKWATAEGHAHLTISSSSFIPCTISRSSAASSARSCFGGTCCTSSYTTSL